jgi:NadR type nicotinamide-nucleotide adenylyltransferase
MRTPFRVALVGSPASGKTTLAQALAKEYGALWVPEYLREFVDQQQRVPVEEDQIHIATTQAAREDAIAAQGGRFLFCDTTPLMTAVYSRHYFGRLQDDLATLLASRQYDITLVCDHDIPWIPDGLHREPEDVGGIIHEILHEELAARAIPYSRIHGPLDERIGQVKRLLGT